MAAPALTFRVTVDDRAVLEALRAARRDLNRVIKTTLIDVGRTHVLPVARQMAPSVVKADLDMTASGTQGYLTIRKGLPKPLRARVAILEFGGTIKTPLRPKPGRQGRGGRPPALRLADGRFVTLVTGPRKITGKHFMQRAVKRVRPRVIQELERRIIQDIQGHVDRTRSAL